ncbi:MAG TPA: M48 family metallopeptidase [Actinomycetota bacterium]|nr:M48 family metallopeptidase [Actinomycetota bacterium]
MAGAVLEEVFTPEEVERARRYHRPLYAAFVANLALGLAALSALAFSPAGDALHAPVAGLPWWAETPAYAGLATVVLAAVRLPLAFWRGYVHERRWGFSTQSVRGWAWDRAKGLAVGVVLNGLLFLGLVGLVRALPGAWPAAVAPAGAAVVLVLTFLGPVVLEPLFNRFTPLADEGLARELRELAARAGVPVREVLVSDASRRTRKENAYVSGLGRTRRVVVYDTLLRRADPAQVRLVVAHELGHRRFRHVARGTALGMLGMAGGVLVVWALLSWRPVLEAVGAAGPADPRVVPFVLLVGSVLQLLAMPLETALSRQWETAADRFSLELTGDREAFERSHRELALANLADLDPPRLLYRWAFTHPTPPERIANARRWAGQLRPTTA